MEASVNNKCRAFTSLEQSKKLAEILPLETADMCFANDGTAIKIDANPYTVRYSMWKDCVAEIIPCWSLASLLEQLPYELCDDDGNSSYLEINKEDDVYQLEYTDPYGDFKSIETDRYEHFVDACYEMILKLHELDLV
jgi:hypothetical protein